ncbi:Longin-like domain-containing protein [Podospora fimiseda]|uniref:Longin-like domain-containing protein n=1 Tax=Podospora fimiseda TaxID=252190 RepID=A0AAN7BTH5_9PEZI|nr:Longin-like domain-containing protein [Podospora fimiseda]
MATSLPSIACLGVIGRNNNPLHVAIFPSHDPVTNTFRTIRTPLQFSLLLSSTLDIFELRSRQNAAAGTGLTGDYGLLHAVDERLAAYGYETNTGVRFVVVVDMRGKKPAKAIGTGTTRDGLREGEMRPVFKAMQGAYVRLLQNPFYDPDEHDKVPGKKIRSRRFEEEIRRIGEGWGAGVVSL